MAINFSYFAKLHNIILFSSPELCQELIYVGWNANFKPKPLLPGNTHTATKQQVESEISI